MMGRMLIGSKLSVLSFLMISGCDGGGIGRAGSPVWELTTTPGQKSDYFELQCREYGFEPGTSEMAHCVQAEAQSVREASSARRSARSYPSQAPYVATPRVATTCLPLGRGFNCF